MLDPQNLDHLASLVILLEHLHVQVVAITSRQSYVLRLGKAELTYGSGGIVQRHLLEALLEVISSGGRRRETLLRMVLLLLREGIGRGEGGRTRVGEVLLLRVGLLLGVSLGLSEVLGRVGGLLRVLRVLLLGLLLEQGLG